MPEPTNNQKKKTEDKSPLYDEKEQKFALQRKFSKEECFEQAKQIRDRMNKFVPGTFNLDDKQLSDIVEKKYQTYEQCHDFMEDVNARSKIFYNILEKQHWSFRKTWVSKNYNFVTKVAKEV